MARVKGAMMTRKRRNKTLKLAKSYWGSKSKHFKMAKQAVKKSGVYAYIGRKQKKRSYRSLWITRISAAVAPFGLNYSRFMNGIKKAGVLTGVLYIVAMLFNISGVMPLVWVSLVVIGFLGAAAPALMNSVPGSVFGRVGYAKVNSVVFPLTNIIFMCNFAVNGLIKKLFNSLSVAYIVFAGLAFLSILLILALQDHKYDQDYMAAHKQ